MASTTAAGDVRLREILTVLLCGIAMGGAIDLWAGWMRTRRSLTRTVEVSDRLRGERDDWRHRAEKLLRGLDEEIDAQLRCWNLTPAERKIALLLLKG